MITNERTGEVVEFVVETAELLRLQVTWTKPGVRAMRHAHPGMEERCEVLEGRAAFEIDGVEMRPALRWAEFVRRLFSGGEDPLALLSEFGEEIVLRPSPA